MKSVLITGCSSGIGLCLAEGLRARGYRVFATARKPEDVVLLAQRGLESIQLDVADSASLRAAIETIIQRSGGRLDALINNAAYGQTGAVEDLRREVLQAQFETNLFGLLELTNQVIPLMRKQGYGRIINIGSLLGYIAMPYRGAYNMSKYALEGLSDTLRLELHGSGISVSLVEPGPTKSKFRVNAYAMYKKNIHPEQSAHRECYVGLERRLTKVGPAAPFTSPPEAVLRKVLHALESPRPRIRYYVGLPSHLFALLKRLLPQRLLDSLLLRISRNEMRE